MDLDPGSWGGLELGLKIGPVKTSTENYEYKRPLDARMSPASA